MIHKLTISLRQHTPLIHFQHDQEGATLRASEIKPKLDRFVIKQAFHDSFDECKEFLIGYNPNPEKREESIRALRNKWNAGYRALDYKIRIADSPDNVFFMETNKKKEYKKGNEEKDKKGGFRIETVKSGEIQNKPEGKCRLVIREEDGKRYYAKWRKTDSKIVYDLNTYPCFFANMGCDINDPQEYRKVTFAEEPFCMTIITRYYALYNIFSDRNNKILSSFFLNTNFGTRQSKGFGSFYIDEDDPLYNRPNSNYHFNVQIAEENYYNEFYSLFETIELFTKTLRAGINNKRGSITDFYFKSLAFMYCKDVLKAEWDKKRVKTGFYFDDSPRRKDSLKKQKDYYPNDEYHDILFFDSTDGYDIRDMFGFSTNEEWQSYSDSIEKKVALLKDKKNVYPTKDDTLPVDRMRSPLLIKPICCIDNENNVSYDIYLLFQDKEVGMDGIKHQQKICIYSKREKNEKGLPKRFMLKIPQSFSMSDYFDYIFNELKINVGEHVEEKYHQHDYYRKLEDIFEQLKNNIPQ